MSAEGPLRADLRESDTDELVAALSVWTIGLGVVVVGAFPLAIPIVVLTAIALIPLALPLLAVAAIAAVPVLAFRWIRAAVTNRRGSRVSTTNRQAEELG